MIYHELTKYALIMILLQVSLYQCTDDGRIKLLQAYTDPDVSR